VTPEVAARLGAAVVEMFGCTRVVLGHDPRSSAGDLVQGLLRGLGGAEVDLLGVAPTPAVAFCSAADGVPGIVVSASHNPYHDNGVKIFGPGGRKLSDTEQDCVAAALRSGVDATGTPAAAGDASDRLQAYLAAVASTVQPDALDGLHLVGDGANGANSALAPALLRRLGASVRTVACEPNGRNINDGCGATVPGLIAARTRPGEVGLAFDGDGDRVVAYDRGLIDGDRIIALCGIDRHDAYQALMAEILDTLDALTEEHSLIPKAAEQLKTLCEYIAKEEA